ncbi:MAG: hypothetical protein RBR87_05075 [Bacteroidales bacterium]|jgi:MFS family permease|nr:hypothetical protein [Bacteroidales bacterium]
MLRNIIAILAGILLGMLTIASIEYLGQDLFPNPVSLVLDEEMYTNDLAYEMIPLPSMLMVLLAYILGSFIAGFFSAFIGQRKSLALISGFILFLGGLINVLIIPHPLWFIIFSLALFIPFAFFGGFVAEKFLIKKK